jgi:heterodisulfide reductase subunit D
VAVGGPTYCCGIVHHRNGDTAAGGGMNKRTVELFQRYKPEEVVMWCPSCMYFYDEIQKFPWPFPVRHATEFLADRLAELEFTHRVDAPVALHYHSQSEPRRREGAAARRLLEAVPGLRYVEVQPEPRFGRLCTVDVQAQLGQDVWDALIRDEIGRARAGGAEILATVYHGCQRMVCGFEAEGAITVEHYLSVFARALGIEFEDRFKKFRLWQDPERVLAESTPCQTANHVDPSRAREFVMKAFGRLPTGPGAGNAPAS